MKDLIIIGAGPAGLSASIYGIRAGLDLTVIEKFSPGGQVINTDEVENYPGFVEPINGWDLMSRMDGQIQRLGVNVDNGDVESLYKDSKDNLFHIKLTGGKELVSKTVIAATGASYRKLKVKGEVELTGKGVSYCATCDGAFYKDRVTAVIGGGDVALEEANFLTRFSSKVYLIHRRDEFRGTKILQDRILANNKIEPIYDSIVESINGSSKVEALSLLNKKSGEKSQLETDGVFIFVGNDPNTGYLPKDLLNEKNEVIVDINMKTKIDGLFAAGDLRSNTKKQIVIAAGDGATAAIEANEYIVNFN